MMALKMILNTNLSQITKLCNESLVRSYSRQHRYTRAPIKVTYPAGETPVTQEDYINNKTEKKNENVSKSSAKMDSIIKMISSKFNDVDHISTSTLAEWLQQGSECAFTHEAKYNKMPDLSSGSSEKKKLMQQNVILLDARAQKEFIVSHLENSHWVGEVLAETQVADLVKEYLLKLEVDNNEVEYNIGEAPSASSVPPGSSVPVNPERSIRFVCYCALGYRSSQLAQKIQVALETENVTKRASVHNLEGSIFKWANEERPMIDNDGNSTKFCHPYNMVFGLTLNKDLRKYE